MSVLYDPGLQPERTLLAWRRTALALALASVVAVRLTAEEFGAMAVAGGVAGVLLAAAAYLAAARRYRRVNENLTSLGRLPGGGAPFALLTATVLLLGLACGAYLLARGVA